MILKLHFTLVLVQTLQKKLATKTGHSTLSNQDSYNSLITDADVTVGEVYYVRVSGYSQNSEGTFCLEISTNSLLLTEEFTSSTLKAYPNPVKDLLHLSNTYFNYYRCGNLQFTRTASACKSSKW